MNLSGYSVKDRPVIHFTDKKSQNGKSAAVIMLTTLIFFLLEMCFIAKEVLIIEVCVLHSLVMSYTTTATVESLI